MNWRLELCQSRFWYLLWTAQSEKTEKSQITCCFDMMQSYWYTTLWEKWSKTEIMWCLEKPSCTTHGDKKREEKMRYDTLSTSVEWMRKILMPDSCWWKSEEKLRKYILETCAEWTRDAIVPDYLSKKERSELRKHNNCRETNGQAEGNYFISHLDLIPDYPGYRKWRKPILLKHCEIMERRRRFPQREHKLNSLLLWDLTFYQTNLGVERAKWIKNNYKELDKAETMCQ